MRTRVLPPRSRRGLAIGRTDVDQSAKSAAPMAIFPQRGFEVFAREIGPQRIREQEFRVRALPQHEIGESVFAGRTYQKIN